MFDSQTISPSACFKFSVFSKSWLFPGKMDAIVKYNIIKILKNYEPLTIEETDDGFNVNLREPSSANRLKKPEVTNDNKL